MESSTGENVQAAAGQGENVQVAAGQGDTAQPAPAQGVNQAQAAPEPQPGEVTPQPGEVTAQPPDKGPVPYERFEEVNRKAREAEAQNKQLQANMFQLQQFVQQAQARQQQGQPQQDPFSEYIAKEGIGKDGFLTAEELPKIARYFEQQSQRRFAEQQQQQWFASHPDYVGLVVTPTGQYSETMMKIIQRDPSIGMALRQNPNPAVAYALCRAEAERAATPNPAPSTLSVPPSMNPVQQIQQAQRAPQPIVTARGTGQMDRQSQIAHMTDEEFREHLAEVKARGS